MGSLARSPRPALPSWRSPGPARHSTNWPLRARTFGPRSRTRPTRRWRGSARSLRPARSRPRRRRQPGDATTPPPDVGDVLRQLEYRRQDRVHLDARGTAQTAATWQPGCGGQQRSFHQWIAGQRRVRRGQGHPAVHRGVRPGRVASCRTGPHGHGGHAEDERRSATWAAGAFARTRTAATRPRRHTSSNSARCGRPRAAGYAVVELVRAIPSTTAPGYLLTGAGLQTLP